MGEFTESIRALLSDLDNGKMTEKEVDDRIRKHYYRELEEDDDAYHDWCPGCREKKRAWDKCFEEYDENSPCETFL